VITVPVITARDRAHARMLEYLINGRRLPFELNGSVIYHCGPLVARMGEEWKVLSAGPTTSARMNHYLQTLLEFVNCVVVVGKGGVDVDMRGKCVYLAYTGGCGALAAESVKRVLGVHWLDLGIPEAVWIFEVERFGPCIVAIDAHGGNIYREVREKAERIFREIAGESPDQSSRQFQT